MSCTNKRHNNNDDDNEDEEEAALGSGTGMVLEAVLSVSLGVPVIPVLIATDLHASAMKYLYRDGNDLSSRSGHKINDDHVLVSES